MKRGIIVSPKIVYREQDSDTPETWTAEELEKKYWAFDKPVFSPTLSDSYLRFWALYWDDIVLPTCGNMVLRMDTSEYSNWVTHGIVKTVLTPTTYLPSMDKTIENFMGRVQDRCYGYLENGQPGRWAIARSPDMRGHPKEDIFDRDGLILSMVELLPCPSELTPLEDIQEFKEKYGNEFAMLRDHVDEIVLEIAESPDRPFAEIVKKRRFEKDLFDAIKATKTSKIEFKAVDMNISFNIPVALSAGLLTYYETGSGIYAIATSTLAGGIGAKLGPSLKSRSNQTTPTPFEYVIKAKETRI